MPSPKGIKIRRWRTEDIPGIVKCQQAAYSDYTPEYWYNERLYRMQYEAFPEGQFVAVQGDLVVGYCTSLIIQLYDDEEWYRVNELTGAGTFSTHDSYGDSLYGADIAVHPEFRGLGIAGMLYERRRRLLRRYNLRRMIAYGRIPGYSDHAGQLTADEYVEEVQAGRLKDSSLNTHLKAGYEVLRTQLDITYDDSSMNYATLLELKNPDFNIAKKRIATPFSRESSRRLRVCVGQYLMEPISSWRQFERKIEFFVNTADSYHSHFLVLPEYLTTQIFSLMKGKNDTLEMVRELSGMTERYKKLFIRLAKEYGMYIVGGTHPTERSGKIYNVAYFFTPGGQVFTQDKLHITPGERDSWGITPGEGLTIFQTPFGRVAILICYDIEFPEICRLLALSGVELILVPFSTSERSAYLRVRYTAQARAVENFLYIALAGNVGNLPTENYPFLHYAQSSVLTPSDIAFPISAIETETDPNVEAVAIAELSLAPLAEVRHGASVRPLHDRRLDLYTLTGKNPVKIVRLD
jgi:predicted amidohydrolase/ribosomal protein S18 acetylase RimI-like enzyme